MLCFKYKPITMSGVLNLITHQLCSIKELSESLGEHRKTIERYAKTFREKGASHFFARKETRGRCYKITETLLSEIQKRIDEGESIYRIAKENNISEAVIR
jgi:transposase